MLNRRLIYSLIAVIFAFSGVSAMFMKPHYIKLQPEAGQERHESVVLIHGLGRHWLSMYGMGRKLRSEGYTVYLYDYPSSRYPIARHSAKFADFLAGTVWPEADGAVHYVGHSLGGIIIRNVLGQRNDVPDGRIVMLAPPNRGSACAVWWGRMRLPEILLVPLAELRSDRPDSYVYKLPIPPLPTGIIIGDADGKVSIAESHLPGNAETDHLVVPAWHNFLMGRADVREATIRFLQQSCFSPDPEG